MACLTIRHQFHGAPLWHHVSCTDVRLHNKTLQTVFNILTCTCRGMTATPTWHRQLDPSHVYALRWLYQHFYKAVPSSSGHGDFSSMFRMGVFSPLMRDGAIHLHVNFPWWTIYFGVKYSTFWHTYLEVVPRSKCSPLISVRSVW